MALKRYEKYPGRWAPATPEQPQGAFKNRTTTVSKDGSFIEKDWINDFAGFFSAALNKAAIVPNGQVDTALQSQYYEAFRTFFYNPENKPTLAALGAAATSHIHTIANVTGLQAALDSKSPAGHKHNIADVNSLQQTLDSKLNISGGTLTGAVTCTAAYHDDYNRAQIEHRGNNAEAQLITRNMREYSTSYWLWEKVKKGSIYYSLGVNGGEQDKVRIDVVSGQIYLDNADKRVYHEGYKPSANDVGAVSVSGGSIRNGRLSISYGGAGFPNNTPSDANNFASRAMIKLSSNNNGLYFFADGDVNSRRFAIQSSHENTSFSDVQGFIDLNPYGGDVRVNGAVVATLENSLGHSQKWSDVLANRVLGVNYTNSTGRPICVSVSTKLANSSSDVKITVDGVLAAFSAVGGGTYGSRLTCANAIIPAGSVYVVESTGDNKTIGLWSELS